MNSPDPNFTTSLSVAKTPHEVFSAITNLRGWWSEEIEGSTDKLGEEFTYRYQDAHRSKMKLVELIPHRKVAWLVLDNYFNFTEDKTEWTGTKLIFDISKNGDHTEIRFTHQGLVPAYECFDVCSNAWASYINGSLRSLISTGKGCPNQRERVEPEPPAVPPPEYRKPQEQSMKTRDYTIAFTVDQTPEEVFAAINNVRGWWSEEIEGGTDKLGAEFEFRYQDLHRSIQKITELVPGKKVAWHVLESQINFVKDKTEWTGTDVIFEIARKDNRTELRFTHIGLVPAIECYGNCSGAWGFYVSESLRSLITTGKGRPARATDP